MKKKLVYNPLKLSVYRHLFRDRKVLVIGGGAVGSYDAENVAKMGSSIGIVDFDKVEMENAAKNSALIRIPEDVGKNKAVCLAERIQPLLDEGCTAHGIDTDLCHLGPEVIAGYDVIILSVDNYAAKILLNQLWLQIPKERRPIVIMNGTYDEMAQSTILDGNEFCLRCLMDEAWLKDSIVRTSCNGPQIRNIEGTEEVVRTTGLASSMAANLSAEQYRGVVIGGENVINQRITYTAYPHMEMSIGRPLRKTACPDCSYIQPPREIRWLDGSVYYNTLDELMEMIREDLHCQDFEIAVHKLFYKNTAYYGFIVDDVCHACGEPIPVMKHEGRTYLQDLRCCDCKKQNKPARYDAAFIPGNIVYAFHTQSEKRIRDMTLYQLGYPLGAHIEVIKRNGAKDFLDEDQIETYTYAMLRDPMVIRKIRELKD